MKRHIQKNKALDFAFVLFISSVLILTAAPTHAQNRVADFTKGSITVGYDNRACDATLEGAIRYHSANACVEFCDAAAWACTSAPDCADDDTATCTLDSTRGNSDPEFLAGYICSNVTILGVTGTNANCGDDTPNAFSFTDQTDVALSTLTASNIIQITGINIPATVTISGDGSPQFRICNNAGCTVVDHDWGNTQKTIDNNQYLQLRLTSNAANSTTNSATVNVGTASDQWDVTTESACPSSGLVAYWQLDESSGTTASDSAGSYPGTTSGGPTWQPSGGKVNGALQLDGSNDQVDMGNQSALIGASHSYAFWLKPFTTTVGDDPGVISKISNTSPFNGFLIGRFGTAIRMFVNNGTASITSSGYFTANTWVFGAVVLDSGTMRLYKNGSEIATGSYSGPTNPSLPFLIGNQNNLGRYYDGLIDDVRVYNRVLTPGEVSTLYNSGAGCQ